MDYPGGIQGYGDPPSIGRESPLNVTPPSPSKEPVVLKSNLHKKGKRFRGWHQRYFEIQGKHMYYYKNHHKTDCLGEIDLSLCTECVVTSEATFGAPFEIRTTLRSHGLSARSAAERDQWIQVIRMQMGSEKVGAVTRTKPKRWKTFKKALRIPQRHQKDNPQTTKGKKSIIGKLKLRKRAVPAASSVQKEPGEVHIAQTHDRPLSLTQEDLPLDTVEVLLDAMPSQSLPATPLARKRSLEVNITPPDSPTFVDQSSFPSTPLEMEKEIIEDDIENEIIEHEAENVTGYAGIKAPILESESREILEKKYTWDMIRDVLQEADNSTVNVDVSCTVIVPEQNVEWMQLSTATEQLRVFLSVCD